MRSFFLKLHRYFGIVIGMFILIASLTGSAVAFYHPLDALINPWQKSVSKDGETPRDPLSLIDAVELHVKDAKVAWVSLSLSHQRSWLYFLEGAHPKKFPTNNEVYVNPYNDEIKGMRSWGDIRQGITNLMPFLYALHYSMALGTFGTGVMGFFALFWFCTILIGVYLTLPKRQGKGWKEWKKMWQWRNPSTMYGKQYHWHKTGGLWLLGLMLILSYSSFALNLPKLHQKFLGESNFQRGHEQVKPLKKPLLTPKMNWYDAREQGRILMAEVANKEGFEVLEESALMYEREEGMYVYTVKSSRDISQEHGSTSVYFDANHGNFLASFIPTGKKAGDTLTQWLYALHQGVLFGTAHKVVLFLLGIASSFFVISGFYLWWKKRKPKQ